MFYSEEDEIASWRLEGWAFPKKLFEKERDVLETSAAFLASFFSFYQLLTNWDNNFLQNSPSYPESSWW